MLSFSHGQHNIPTSFFPNFFCVQVCAWACACLYTCMCVFTKRETESDKLSGQGAKSKAARMSFKANLSHILTTLVRDLGQVNLLFHS